uniref:Uncharacterized protein n=1 Tax=viral metagenome TaxID=1070528 RepID=A0A6C0CAD3_9ZZZZ
MYLTHDVMKEKLKDTKNIKKYYAKWVDRFTGAFDYLDESNYYDETPGYENCSEFEDVKSLVRDAVKTLKLLSKRVNKKKELKILIGKIVAFDIFAGRIEIRKTDMLWLINFIEWDCRILFEYAEEWASSEESCGCNMEILLNLADKHEKKIKGYRNSDTIFALLMAVGHCRSKLAEDFIIDNKIKWTYDSDDALIDDMVEYFEEERSYDLMRGKMLL